MAATGTLRFFITENILQPNHGAVEMYKRQSVSAVAVDGVNTLVEDGDILWQEPARAGRIRSSTINNTFHIAEPIMSDRHNSSTVRVRSTSYQYINQERRENWTPCVAQLCVPTKC